jgi:hypothetical protein
LICSHAVIEAPRAAGGSFMAAAPAGLAYPWPISSIFRINRLEIPRGTVGRPSVRPRDARTGTANARDDAEGQRAPRTFGTPIKLAVKSREEIRKAEICG